LDGALVNQPTNSDPAPAPGRLLFGNETPQQANPTYSTFVTHEYAHFWLYMVPEITVYSSSDGYIGGFHEGFSDTLAHLVHDTEFWAEDLDGCGLHGRNPNASNITYPSCVGGLGHTRGMLLSKIWLNLLNLEFRPLYGQETGYDETRELHLGWMLLAQPPGPDSTFCTTRDQSASEETLIEVLVIDSPTDHPANAVHLEEICDAFNLQNIDDAVCPDSAGTPRSTPLADCDSNGLLNVLDYLCFQDRFLSAEPYADCDGDDRLTVLDYVCFQDAFVSATGD